MRHYRVISTRCARRPVHYQCRSDRQGEVKAVGKPSESSGRRDARAIEAAVAALVKKFGNRLVTSRAVCEQHGNTTTWIANEPPDAVVFPQNVDDVQEVVRTCAAHRVPVIAFGTGTSLEGHVNAPLGGVSIDRTTGRHEGPDGWL